MSLHHYSSCETSQFADTIVLLTKKQQIMGAIMEGFASVVLLVVGLAIVIAFMAVKQVPQGQEWTVERFGRYVTTLRPGLSLIIPFMDRVGCKLVMMEQVLDIDSQGVISRDNAMVTVDGVVFFQVIDAARAAYEISDLLRAIRNLTITNIRTVLGSLDLDEMLSQRDQINSQLLTVIDEATTPWGVKVTRIEIKDISPPKDLVDSMAAQMKAERVKRAVILEAEGVKQAQILQAEGKKEASFREAEARERLAQAEATATRTVSVAISEGSIQAINYFVAQKYIASLEEIAKSPNQKILMLPVEAASVIGSIAGIGEIAKEAFGKNK